MSIRSIERASAAAFQPEADLEFTRELDSLEASDFYVGVGGEERSWELTRFGPASARDMSLFQARLDVRSGVIAEDDYTFLNNPVNTLRPVIHFNIFSGEADVTVKKPGVDVTEFQNRLLRHEIYKETNAVQTSFYGIYNGVGYLLTVTEGMGSIYPTVTKITKWEDNDGHFTMGWSLASSDEAKQFLNDPTNRSKFKCVYDDALQNGFLQKDNPKAIGYNTAANFDAYSKQVQDRLGIVSGAEGQIEYDTKTGLCRYVQNIDFSTPGMGLIINTIGSNNVIGAALKFVYNSVFATTQAGARGEFGNGGKPILDQGNSKYIVQP